MSSVERIANIYLELTGKLLSLMIVDKKAIETRLTLGQVQSLVNSLIKLLMLMYSQEIDRSREYRETLVKEFETIKASKWADESLRLSRIKQYEEKIKEIDGGMSLISKRMAILREVLKIGVEI